MRDLKAFEDAVVSARAHIATCRSPEEEKQGGVKCWTCLTSRALVDAHVELEYFKLSNKVLTRCDLGHVFMHAYRVDGECPFCAQLVKREQHIEFLRAGIKNLDEIDARVGALRHSWQIRMLEFQSSSRPVIPQIHKAMRQLQLIHDRLGDPALRKMLMDETIEPLKAAFSHDPGRQP